MAHKTSQAVKFIANTLKFKNGLLSTRNARCCIRLLATDGAKFSILSM